MNNLDILDHFTELDRSILKRNDEYADYFNFLRDVFSLLIESFNQRTNEDPLEMSITKDFIQRFLNSVEALRLKYYYEEDHSLKIDLTDSSFPNFIEFRELEADLKVRDAKLQELPPERSLKQAALDYLFQHKEKPVKFLKQLSRRAYYESLEQEKLYLEFTPGKVHELGVKGPELWQFVYSWASFDSVTNRPYLYLMIFDHDLSGNNGEPGDSRFVDKIKRATHNTAPLKVVISDIDNDLPGVQPKVLKRTDLGPIYGRYSKDGNVLSQLVQTHFTQEDFVFLFNTEIIFSIGQQRSEKFTKGKLKQVFFVDESNRECIERMVSKVHKYMLAYHHVVQHLREFHKALLLDLSMPPITFNGKITDNEKKRIPSSSD